MKLQRLVYAGLAIAIVLAVPAFGARPTKPYLRVDMASASTSVAGSTTTSSFTLSGCGYTKLTTIIVWHDGTGPYREVTPDADGCVSATFSPFGLNPAGSYIGQSWQKRGNGWDQSAEVRFSVS